MKKFVYVGLCLVCGPICGMDFQPKLSLLSCMDAIELQRNNVRQKEVVVPEESTLLELFDTVTLSPLIEKNSLSLACIQKLAGKKCTVQSLIDESAQIISEYRRGEKNPYESGAMAKRITNILKILLNNEPKIYAVILEEKDAYLPYDSANEHWD